MAEDRLAALVGRKRVSAEWLPHWRTALQAFGLAAVLQLGGAAAADAAPNVPPAPKPAQPASAAGGDPANGKSPKNAKPAGPESAAPKPGNAGPNPGGGIGAPVPGGGIGGAAVVTSTGNVTVVVNGNAGPAPIAPTLPPAPDLLATSPAIQARVATLIQLLDSPKQPEAVQALDELVQLDGPAIEPIEQAMTRSRLTLNMQHRLRDALTRIAQQVPEPVRKALFQQALKHHVERVALVQKWLGRSDGAGPAPKLESIPRTLDEVGMDAILALPGAWPSRFLEKFLMAGGLYEPGGDLVEITPQAMARQRILQRRRQMMARMQNQMEVDSENTSFRDLILAAREEVRGGLSTSFLIRWRAAMAQLHPEPEAQSATDNLFLQCMASRQDPAALAWARMTARESLSLVESEAELAQVNGVGDVVLELQSQLAIGALELLGVYGTDADLALVREVAFKEHNPCRWFAFEKLRTHWTAQDIPMLATLIRNTEKEAGAGGSLIGLVETLEDVRLDEALAARADLFKLEDYSWSLTTCVLARNSPALTAAAEAAWFKDGKVPPNMQGLVLRLGLKKYFPAVLDDVFSLSNQRLSYDTNPSLPYQMLLADEALVKPRLYALSDILGENRTEYKETPNYTKALFDALQEQFKNGNNGNNGNDMYVRARLLAESRMMLASTGDQAMVEKIAACIVPFVNNNNQSARLAMDQLMLSWYKRLLPKYPLPGLTVLAAKVQQRNFDNGQNDDPAQMCDPVELRMLLQGAQNNPQFVQRRRRMVFENGQGYGQSPVGLQGAMARLGYTYATRFEYALQFHSPDLALELYRDHPAEFQDDPAVKTRLASAAGEVGQYAMGAAILEERLQLDPTNATILNNLAWMYATALDPAWNKFDKAVAYAEKSVRQAPAESNSIDTRAYARLVAGRYAEALADFEAAYRLTQPYDPSGMASSLARQARALHYLKRDDEALARLVLAERLHSTDGDTLWWIARGYGLIGRKDDALRVLSICEAGGYMYFEQIEHNPDFEGARKERLFSEILDNMKRHRALVRAVLIESTPVSELPADIDANGSVGDEDEANGPMRGDNELE